MENLFTRNKRSEYFPLGIFGGHWLESFHDHCQIRVIHGPSALVPLESSPVNAPNPLDRQIA
jgi:hypothetical protein